MTDNVIGLPGERLISTQPGIEYRGHLLAREDSDSTFWALYTDGTTERINPSTGKPRPTPDTAVRTKGMKVADSFVTTSLADDKPASRHSGQMRRVVQCFHIRGKESPFSYVWTKTHGILEYPFPRVIGGTAAAEAANELTRTFWLIEISADGVYAGRLKVGKNCLTCATNIADYKPTAEQIKADPSLNQYDSQISLHWIYGNRNANGVVTRLMDAGEIAPAYASGSPWTADLGWAFSYSGRAAANVVKSTASISVHTTRLMSIAITAVPAGEGFNLSAVLTVGVAASCEFRGEVTANVRGSTLHLPGSNETSWTPVLTGTINNTTVDLPIHVYYDGETQILTRWSMAVQTVPAVSTNTYPNFSLSGGNLVVQPMLTEGEYTIKRYGFYNSKVDTREQHDRQPVRTISGGGSIASDVRLDCSGAFSVFEDNYFEGTPEVFLVNQGGTDYTVTHRIPFNVRAWRIDALRTTFAYFGSSMATLFRNEREAIGLLKNRRTDTQSRMDFLGCGSVRGHEPSVFISSTPPGYSYTPFPATEFTVLTFPPGYPIAGTGPTSASSTTGSFSYCGVGNMPNESWAIAPSVDYQYFIEVTHAPGALSRLSIMRGGLFYSDPRLSPADQKQNLVYSLAGGAKITRGGFPPLSGKRPLAFIGQV